jgi:hypothetical protein
MLVWYHGMVLTYGYIKWYSVDSSLIDIIVYYVLNFPFFVLHNVRILLY